MLTKKEIRDRHRAKQWVQEKEAAYAAERYARFKTDPELYERRLKQARESSIIRKWRGEACNAGLRFSGVSMLVLGGLFTAALLELNRESVEHMKARHRGYPKRDRSEYYAAIKADPVKLSARRERLKVRGESRPTDPNSKDLTNRERSSRMSRERHLRMMANPEYREKIRQQERARSSTDEGRKQSADYMTKRRRENPSVRIVENIRRRINYEIKAKHENGRTADLLGMSIRDFMAHLESQWTEGMTWDNYGNGNGKWNLDHRTPCAFFDLTNLEQQKLCFNYANCQPMWFRDNCIKNSRLSDGSKAIRRPSAVDSLGAVG